MQLRKVLGAAALLSLGASAGCGGGGTAPQVGRYTVVDLGAPTGFTASDTRAINKAGQVLGAGFASAPASPPGGVGDNAGIGIRQASLYNQGKWTAIGLAVNGLNDVGQVAGRTDSGSAPSHAAIWQDGVVTDLGTLGGDTSSAEAINNKGVVVGTSPTGQKNGAGLPIVDTFVWQNDKMQDLGALNITAPFAINDSGVIACNLILSGGALHAALLQNGVVTDLDKSSPHPSAIHAVNASGQTVGSTLPIPTKSEAALWQNGTRVDLGYLPNGTFSDALSINDAGRIVGQADTPDQTSPHAFLWQNGVMTDLNTRIDPTSGWVLSTATGINNQGQICGSGVIHGATHAFLLIPR